jgi:hypothetical protein
MDRRGALLCYALLCFGALCRAWRPATAGRARPRPLWRQGLRAGGFVNYVCVVPPAALLLGTAARRAGSGLLAPPAPFPVFPFRRGDAVPGASRWRGSTRTDRRSADVVVRPDALCGGRLADRRVPHLFPLPRRVRWSFCRRYYSRPGRCVATCNLSAGANIPNQMFRHPTWRSFLPLATLATAAKGSPTTTHNEQEPHLLGHTTLHSLYLLHSQIIKTLQTSCRNGGYRPRPQNNITPALSHSISIPQTFQHTKATPP